MPSRRSVLALAGAGALLGSLSARAAVAPSLASLSPITGLAKPIAREEYEARLHALRESLAVRGWGALLVESGSTLEYFTGVRWRRSERTTAAILPAKGDPVIVTPVFEEPSVRETLAVTAEVRPWNEPESPFARLAGALKDRGSAPGVLAVEPTTRFFIVEGVRALTQGLEIRSGDPVVRERRMIKSPAELELMRVANAVTIKALAYVHANIAPGMSEGDIAGLMDRATAALGGSPEFSLVLLNEASAYPHGSLVPQVVREGSVILMDCGCAVHGYQSDISRSWVYGEPTPRQRKVWDTVKRGQEIALETAKVGTPAGALDDAVRRYYEKEGWGPAYRLPGLSHRTGHGIGLDGHEAPYLVHGDDTPLAPGMCFSDEPGLYIPGAFGIRLEDCWRVTEQGPEPFTRLARSLEDPI